VVAVVVGPVVVEVGCEPPYCVDVPFKNVSRTELPLGNVYDSAEPPGCVTVIETGVPAMYCVLLFLLFPALTNASDTVVPFGNELDMVTPFGKVIT